MEYQAPLIDSHCHLQSLDLSSFPAGIDEVLALARAEGMQECLSVCIELEDVPKLQAIADQQPGVYTSVGIHPNVVLERELTAAELEPYTRHRSCIAIGETGLDYYRTEEAPHKEAQWQRFAAHIRLALQLQKPLIIHTREAAEDTLRCMREEGAAGIGGVMHCFAESFEVAKASLDLNFYISLSGILTFKNASTLQDLAKKLPLDRILIETDAPYLAPVPFRGKQNHPALVKQVALKLSELLQLDYAEVAEQTTANFYRCFRLTRP